MKFVSNNLIHVIKRFTTPAILNILGLSIAFTAFLLIVIQVKSEYNFEKCHSKADRIYRIDGIDFKTGDNWFIFSRPLTAAVIASSPHIVRGTLINPYLEDIYVTVEDGNNQKGFKEAFITCNADITQMFDFRMIEGDAECLKKPENIIIPNSIAKKMFGNKSAIGKHINLAGSIWSKQNNGFLVVGGVFEDFPENTQLKNYIYTAIADNYAINDWGNANYFCYVLLDENTKPEDIANNFNKNFDFSKISNNPTQIGIELTPLPSIYFKNNDLSGQLIKSGSKTTPFILTTIGILIIIIAIINYTNINMALVSVRIRSINIRKILGSTDAALRFELIMEGVIISLISYLLSIVFVIIIDRSNALSFISTSLAITENIFPVLFTGGVAIITGFVASIRPAFYMTSYSPALILKGNYGLSSSGKKLQVLLVGFQFLISITLIIVSFFIYKQNIFMQKYTIGYDTDNIAIVELPQSIAGKERDRFTSAIKENPDVADIAFSHQKFGSSDNYRSWGGKHNGESVNFYSLSVSWNFLDIMNIPIIEGQRPNENTKNDSVVSYVINKSLQRKYGIKVGDIIDIDIEWLPKSNKYNNRVIGIIDDVKFRSLRNESANMAFVFNDKNWQLYSYIRIRSGADIKKTKSFIEKTIADFDSSYPSKIEFYDEVFNNLYKQEIKIETIVNIFSILAVMISIMGVFGMVMLECEYKQKEIGMRKIMGSSELEVIQLICRNYLLIFIACFILSTPLSCCILMNWLENFSYRTTLDWWGFVLSGLVVLLVTITVVIWQSWKAATANPVETLKND